MKCIVIAISGFVFIGNRTVRKDETSVLLDDASNIRVWGTTKGLGQIALEGPTKETVLDPVGSIEFPMNSVIGIIPCRV